MDWKGKKDRKEIKNEKKERKLWVLNSITNGTTR